MICQTRPTYARTARGLSAILVAATLFAISAAPDALAQNRSRQKAAPKAQREEAPKQAATAATPARAPAQQLYFSPWAKLCEKDADPKAKRVCVTVMDGHMESGLLVISVAVIEREGEQKKQLRMSLPYGVSLQRGARLIIDRGAPVNAPFVACLPPAAPPGGCIADYEATTDLINRMKKAQVLTVQATHMNGQAMSPQLDLTGFAKAYEGPPTDPKAFEQQQRKFQEELQKHAAETRSRQPSIR